MKENVFDSAESMMAMVTAAGLSISEEKITSCYQEMESWYAKIKAEKIEEFFGIKTKKSPRRYRTLSEIMDDVVGLWVNADSLEREKICKAIITSGDCRTFYEIMGCFDLDAYQVDITDAEQDSIFSSVEKMKDAYRKALIERDLPPGDDTIEMVYKNLQIGYKRASQNEEYQNILHEIGIDIAGHTFCEVAENVATQYSLSSSKNQCIIDKIFYTGEIMWRLAFENTMARYKHVLAMQQIPCGSVFDSAEKIIEAARKSGFIDDGGFRYARLIAIQSYEAAKFNDTIKKMLDEMGFPLSGKEHDFPAYFDGITRKWSDLPEEDKAWITNMFSLPYDSFCNIFILMMDSASAMIERN